MYNKEVSVLKKEDIDKIKDIVEVWDLEQADESLIMIVYKEDIKSMRKVIEASRKQIAIKIKWDDCRCPICREKLQGYEKYCWECGKMLDWY